MERTNPNPIIFRTYKTYGNYYVYDRHTNSVITLNHEEFRELQAVEKGEKPWEESSVIARYQKEGMFQPNVVKEIRHPQTDIMEHNAEKRLHQLTLQVTQQCNLRCEYCAYSGIYEGNRVHSGRRMSFETAKKAIDFFLEHSMDSPLIVVGFYGGEPLLEFSLIKKCVSYVEERCEGKKILFNLTTNGTLLEGERAEFLVKHEFSIAISLDGSKKEHDACRKFPDGSGSFDIVMEHIKNLSNAYPRYTERSVRFFTTVNPYMDLGCVLEYFKTSEVINDRAILFNQMVAKDLKEEVAYQESFFQIRKYEYIKMLFVLIGKLEKEQLSPLVSASMDYTKRAKRALHKRKELGCVIHPGGPCMPGILRLFVRYDGEFFPCERVNENLDFFRIGSIEEGLCLDKMREILNIGKLTEEECKTCWNLQRCSMCSNEIALHGNQKPEKKDKLMLCKEKRSTTEFELYEQSVLKEFGYTTDSEVM